MAGEVRSGAGRERPRQVFVARLRPPGKAKYCPRPSPGAAPPAAGPGDCGDASQQLSAAFHNEHSALLRCSINRWLSGVMSCWATLQCGNQGLPHGALGADTSYDGDVIRPNTRPGGQLARRTTQACAERREAGVQRRCHGLHRAGHLPKGALVLLLVSVISRCIQESSEYCRQPFQW